MLLKKPNELAENTLVAGLVYGQPGIGKSTLALSGPNPVMIDTDLGMKRVEKRFRVSCIQPQSYKEVLELFEGNELNPFETIVIDTLGKFADMIGDYVCDINPKNRRKEENALSIQGWGAVKAEFQRFLRIAKTKNKHLIFVAHEREEKEEDVVKKRPDVSGSSGKDLVKDLDFMGYMQAKDNRRTISFTPSEKFYAKNSLRLPISIEVPDTSKAPNDFIKRHIIERTHQRIKEDEEMNKKYDGIISELSTAITSVTDAKTAAEVLEKINKFEVLWDSQRVAKSRLNEKAKELGLVYDRAAKVFKTEPQVQVQPQPESVQAA